MSDKLEIVKAVAPFAAPLTAAIVEQWIKPKLVALHKYIKTDKALFENALASKFDEYLQRAYEKNLYINVIVFQNQRKRLEDLYIPLTLGETNEETRIALDSYKEEFLPTYRKVLIRDTAGMGKTTIMKWLFLSCVKKNEGIPIFIELRKLKSDESILSYIYSELNPIDDEFDKDFILKLIKQGDFIFFLDGYDEIPSSRRDEVTRNLQDFIAKASNNLFLLTSRPETALASFSDFQEFNIEPLKLEEAFDLLRKYDEGGELSTGIISKLEGDTLESIEDFLENPLLVSLLYKSYEYKPIIHVKKHIFYRQVYDALFESHDLTKGGSFVREKHSQLNIEDFHRVLRALGFLTVKLGQIEFDKDMLLSLLSQAKERSPGLEFKVSDFLRDLLTTVPLFNRDGNYYKWAHKSIQEYFAAQYIWLDSKGNQSKILRQMVRSKNNDNYENVLDLYYDMDYKTFRQTIIYDYLCEFEQYFNSTYLSINREQISEDDIHYRRLLTFGRIFLIIPKSLMRKLSETVESYYSRAIALTEEKAARFVGYKPGTVWSVGLVSYESHNNLISRLLRTKKEEIFLNDKAIIALSHSTRSSFENMGGDAILVIDDDPLSLFNQEKYFAITTSTLAEHTRHYVALLDRRKSKILQLQIANEIETETAGEFFSDI